MAWACGAVSNRNRAGYGTSACNLHRFLYSFGMTVLDSAESLLITEASKLGVSRLAADAEEGHAKVLERRGRPVAAVVGYGELQRIAEMERDLVDVALVLTRAATDTGARTSLDDVIEKFGFTREQLNSMDDPA